MACGPLGAKPWPELMNPLSLSIQMSRQRACTGKVFRFFFRLFVCLFLSFAFFCHDGYAIETKWYTSQEMFYLVHAVDLSPAWRQATVWSYEGLFIDLIPGMSCQRTYNVIAACLIGTHIITMFVIETKWYVKSRKDGLFQVHMMACRLLGARPFPEPLRTIYKLTPRMSCVDAM